MLITKNWSKQNDENLSELELKSFWHKKVFVPKWIWLYLSQFLTVFDEPKTQLKVINVVTRACNARDRLTSCNRLQPVFEWFLNIFEMRQLATEITRNLGNRNRKIDRTMVRFSSVRRFFSVLWTGLLNTMHKTMGADTH